MFKRQIGVILGVTMRVAQQAVEIAVTLLILRYQHQRILQYQRQVVVALEVYLRAIVQLETAMMTLLADVFEFSITTRKPVSRGCDAPCRKLKFVLQSHSLKLLNMPLCHTWRTNSIRLA